MLEIQTAIGVLNACADWMTQGPANTCRKWAEFLNSLIAPLPQNILGIRNLSVSGTNPPSDDYVGMWDWRLGADTHYADAFTIRLHQMHTINKYRQP